MDAEVWFGVEIEVVLDVGAEVEIGVVVEVEVEAADSVQLVLDRSSIVRTSRDRWWECDRERPVWSSE
ncbi:hypothetical protein C482_02616 [Natrialba chahannaoensis JCM 10990]|uniref:Uncharacterized protein n=1 Tax=Natrialba chahannaoensis JCM 10990 TaxID=1227492 RepID=M0B2A7_9EURY|nr:hypothetical protein C482_02616 [Natrialba chahannaoensis JCM 10990]